MNEKFEEAKRASAWVGDPRISTRTIVKEVARHTGLDYDQASDCIYAFLNIVKFAAFSSDQKVVIRNFGQFVPTKVQGREYGRAVGSPIYIPARIKLTLKASPLVEVDRWKNMLSIQKKVSTALGAKLKPRSMDLSICVRIADLVLSNRPIGELRGKDKIAFIRQWIHAVGASPLLPAPKQRHDEKDRPFHILTYRLCGSERTVGVFDHEVSSMFAAVAVKDKNDILFFDTGWVSAADATASSVKDYSKPLKLNPYGDTPEEQTESLFRAYMAAKYGKK